MARLPNVGADANAWGALLNDFLLISHRTDGTLRSVCAVINVHDFGAIGDGKSHPLSERYNTLADAQAAYPTLTSLTLTDEIDWAAVQSAINAAATSGTVCLPAGTYMLNKPFTLFSKVHLRGAGQDTTILDFSTYTADAPVITAKGLVSTAVNVTGVVSLGATSFAVSQADIDTLGLTAGDRLLLGSDEPFKGLIKYHRGEQVIIKSIESNNIILYSPTFDDYGTSSPARIVKLTSITDSGVHDLTVRRNAQETSPTKGILYWYAERVTISNVRLQHCTEAAIRIFHGLACIIENCSIEDAWYQGTGTSYGVSLDDACQECRVMNNYFRRFRHAISIGKSNDVGIPRMILCEGNVADQTADVTIAAAFDIHPPAQYIAYIGNTARTGKSTPGFAVDGYDVIIANNVVYGGGGIRVGIGNAAYYLVDNNADLRTNHIISGNHITLLPGALTHGISVCTSGCSIIGNRITAMTPFAGSVIPIWLFIYSNATGVVNVPTTDVLVTENQIYQGQGYGIYVGGGQRIRISNNVIRNISSLGSSYGIFLTNNGPNNEIPCTGVDIVDNTIFDDTGVTGIGIRSNSGSPPASDLFSANNYIKLTEGSVPINIPTGELGVRY